LNVLLLVPESARDVRLALHGSSKDVACLESYFDARGMPVARVALPRRNREAMAELAALEVAEYDAIVLSMPGSYPRLLRWIKARAPHSLVLFRAHNAEALHRLDWMRASTGMGERMRLGIRAARALVKDLATVHAAADGILSISSSDTRQYWRLLGGGTRVATVPYFMVDPPPVPTESKDDLCVCVSAIEENPLVRDAANNFCRMVDRLGESLPGWRFALIGSSCATFETLARVEPLGLLDSPLEVLGRARAMALMSDYGRGFKTKILEAIHARCWVLVTPRLYARLPGCVRPFCMTVRAHSAAEFADALERCRQPWPHGDANAALREEAFETLDALFRSRARSRVEALGATQTHA